MDNQPDSQRLAGIAARHGGLFTREEAKRCGYSAYQIRRRVQVGEWLVVLGPVLGLAGLELTPSVRDRAAQRAVPGSVLAGPSAARCWQMPVSGPRPYLYVGQRTSPRVAGIRFLFSMPDPRDIGRTGSVRITWRERTVFDCMRLLPEREATALLDRALQRRWTSVDDLVDRIHREPGRRGLVTVVRLVRAVTDGTRSVAERRTGRLLGEAGIDGWRANRPIRDQDGLVGIGDIVFEALKLVVELDGQAFHVSPESFQRDRERQNRLMAAGWTVLRFTWRDLTDRPEHLVAQVRASIRRLSR